MSKSNKRKLADKRKPVKDLKGIRNGPYPSRGSFLSKKFKASRYAHFEVYDVGDLVVLSLPTSKPDLNTVEFEAEIKSISVLENFTGELVIRYEMGQIPMRVIQEIRRCFNFEGVLWVKNSEIVGKYVEGRDKYGSEKWD